MGLSRISKPHRTQKVCLLFQLVDVDMDERNQTIKCLSCNFSYVCSNGAGIPCSVCHYNIHI